MPKKAQKMDDSTYAELKAKILKSLGDTPYVFRNSKQRQALDGLSAAVMSNLDGAGQGPERSLMCGRKRAYFTDSYATWLMGRISAVK